MKSISVQYWRSLEHLENWTRKARSHSSARARYHKALEAEGLFGIWCAVPRLCARMSVCIPLPAAAAWWKVRGCAVVTSRTDLLPLAHCLERHETYVIRPGSYENFYDDMPPFVRSSHSPR